jgi:hypothetical protein
VKKKNLSKSTTPANWKCFAGSFIAIGIYSAILISCFSPGVMVNDDIAMMSFSNGDFTGTPESQLVFIGFFVGGLLKLLYSFSSTLPWYALLFVLLQILSGSVLLTVWYKILKGRINRSFLSVAGLVALVTPVLVLDLSFSTTAMYLSACGLVSLALVVENYREQGPLITVAIASILVLASSLRFDFFLAAALLILPIYLLHLKNLSRLTAMLTLGILLLPVATHFVENQISKTDDWARYREFNALRGSMHGTPGLARFVAGAYEKETYEKTREFGWESEDLLLFGNWYFEDAQIFNVSSLERLRENIDTGVTRIPLQASLENIIFGRELLILFGVMIVFFGATFSVSKQKNFILFQALWFLTIAVYISSRTRFPDRFAVGAVVGLYICMLAANLILVSRQASVDNENDFRHRKIEILFFTGLIITGVFLFPHKFSAAQISNQNKIESTRLKTEIQTLDDVDPNGTFVYIGAQITAEGINPWTDRTLLKGNRLLGLGWATQSPHQEKRKQAMDLDGDFLSQFVDSPNRYLIASKKIAELLEYSFERRKKSQIKFDVVVELPFGTVYGVASENAVIKASDDTEVTKRQRP